MILYTDTSSLLKLYLEEPFSEQVRQRVGESSGVVTSIVSYVEVHAGLARGERGLRLTQAQYRDSVSAFDRDWKGSLAHVDLSDELVQAAAKLAQRFYLRGLDAIHLASAVSVSHASAEPLAFSAFDDRLLDAAEECGLTRA